MATAPKKKKATRKKAAARPAPDQLPRLPISEILAVIGGTVGVFLCLALVSYHPDDPSWDSLHVSDGVHGDIVQNWMGSVGSHLADLLIQWFGFPSVVFPLVLLLFSYSLFRHRALNWPFLRIAASVALTLFCCILLAFYPGKLSALRSGSAGGVVGATIEEVLQERFNRPGTLVMILSGLVLSLQLTLALEVGPPLLRVVHFFEQLVRRTLRMTGGAVALGAGAVGQAAVSGAATVGQRIKEGAAARREEAERRRQDAELEEEEDEEEEETPRVAGRARVGGRKAAPLEDVPEPARRKGRPGAKIAPPEEDAFASMGTSSRSEGAGSRAPSRGRAADAPAVPAAPAAGRASAALEEGLELDDPLDEPDQDAFDEGAGQGGVGGNGGRAPRQRTLPFEPKIVKSKYMEEPQRLSDHLFTPTPDDADFKLPQLEFLKAAPHQEGSLSEEELLASARLLEEKLRDYGVEGRVVEIHPGPVITMYEYAPAPGVKVSKITNLSNDLALALRATAVRIVAPLPGKAAVGIEVPNKARQTVYLREVVEHEEFRREVLKLPMAIGKDIEGRPYAADMARMPHLLVAGSTGAGKSVAVNAMLISLLYARKPEDVRFILVDPKMIEFSVYNDIPHLLMPVVTDPKKAAMALNWGVDEMTRRYQLLTLAGARNIASYNTLMEDRLKNWDENNPPEGMATPRKLPYIVIVIDELADLMMVAGKEVQESIVRLAQMARAAGIHLILATQRPSVDVITGLIKANFPARIAFKVSSKTDSRTILDANGAEYLLGNGDMLFLPPGTASLLRLHGAFVSDEEARLVVEHLRKQGQPRYEESLLASTADDFAGNDPKEEEDYDEFYEEAKQIVLETGQASISTIQRRLKIGYNRSARMVERMCKEGLVGPPTQGGKPREVFSSKLQASLR